MSDGVGSPAGGLPVAREWFALTDLGGGVTRVSEPHVHELLRANAFLVKGRDRDLVVDSGLGIESMRSRLERAGLVDKPIVAVATHAHMDHIGSMHEFSERWIHEAEAADMRDATDDGSLLSADFDGEFVRMCAELGMELPPVLLTALPDAGYDPAGFRVRGAEPTRTLSEADVVDLGDRRFEILHLPGHSPGGIGLYDAEAGVLFSGDAIYDGVLLDEALPGSDIPAYVLTMRRLIDLPVSLVHPGHENSFDRARMIELARQYLARRDAEPMSGG
jgi:glyoxylase-like metal-dependent hydrolase (beta-lactamase superfamily II)